MSCHHEREDAAYVLGALSPTERAAFEHHLPGCEPCTRATSELAGLPGLLARVPLDQAESPAPQVPAEPVPDTLLPGLVHQVRARQRRRSLSIALGAAAAVAVVATGLGIALTGSSDPVRPDQARLEPAVAMRSLADDPVAAEVSLTSVGWGTRLELTCDERDERSDEPATSSTTAAWASYAMYVHTRDGRVERVATWKAVPGGVVHVSGATSTDRSDITEVDVRNAAGVPVLNLDDSVER